MRTAFYNDKKVKSGKEYVKKSKALTNIYSYGSYDMTYALSSDIYIQIRLADSRFLNGLESTITQNSNVRREPSTAFALTTGAIKASREFQGFALKILQNKKKKTRKLL